MYSGNFVFPRSWIIYHGPFSINVSPTITATSTSKLSIALNSTVVWLLPNLLIDQVYEILKYVCAHRLANFITWVLKKASLAITFLTRINHVIGEFMLNFLKI